MKNMKTHLTRLVVIFSSLVLLLSTVVALPISANAPGSDPLPTGTMYEVSYDNGVYTISIDAERLAEILNSPSFNKEMLESVLPETVYDLIINRNKDAVSQLLSDLIEESHYGDLKDDLPIDVLTDHFSTEDIISIVNMDALLKVIDIDEIIASLTPEQIENIFIEGKLEELLEGIDLSGVIDADAIDALMDVLTPAELEAALKPGAVKALIDNGAIKVEDLMTDENIQELFKIEHGLITDAEIEALINDKDIIDKIINDDAILKSVLHNPEFLAAATNHPEIITDLMQDKVIVKIFIEHALLDDFYDILTAEELKKIVLSKDIDISALITPDFINSLDPAVIKNIISQEDIKKLANDYLTEDELRTIIESNNCLDTSKVKFSHIYPEYIKAADIKASGVITTAELKTLSSCLTPAEKQTITNNVEFSNLSLSAIYKADGTGYITDADIKSKNVISTADIDTLIGYLEADEKQAIIDKLGHSNLAEADFSLFYPYLSESEIKSVISDADYDALASLISEDDKITIAIEHNCIDITTVANYIDASEIMDKNIIDSTDLDTLQGLLTTQEKATIALNNDYIDFTKINFADFIGYITVDDIKASGIITNDDLNKLDANIFFNAGFTAEDILATVPDRAQFVIDLYNEGYISASEVNFEKVIGAVEHDELAMNAIVAEIKSVPAIMEHINDMIMDEITILSHIVDHQLLYTDGIITDAMIFGGIENGKTYPGILDSNDIQKILKDEIISKDLIFDSIIDMNALLDQIIIENLPIDKILEALDVNELVDEILKQNRQGLIDALDIPYLIRLDAVQNELRSLTITELRSIIDIDTVKNVLIPKVLLLPNRFESIFINNTPIFINPGKINVANIEYAMLESIPSFDKIANVGADGIISSLVFKSSVEGEGYFFGFEVKLTGDTTDIKEYAQNVTEKFSFVVDTNGDINTKVTLPAKIADLYISAIDSNKLPAALKNKLKNIANVEFNKSDIGDLGEAIIKNLSISEIKDLLAAVNIGSLDDTLLSQLDMRASQAQLILDYATSAVNKAVSILETSPEADSILSTFNDKKLCEFYTGDGTFVFEIDYFFDPLKPLENKLPNSIKDFITDTRIEHHTNTTIVFEGLYSANFQQDGEIVYTAFRTEGYDLSKITAVTAANGWGGADGIKVDTMPAEDVTLARIYNATFKVQYANGTHVEDVIVPFTELSDLTNIKIPEHIVAPDHYELTWDTFTVENKDFTVNGIYSPIEYTVTFMVDGAVFATRTYNIENLSITEPDIPQKDGYSASWEAYDLNTLTDITVNATYIAEDDSVFYITFVDEHGNEIEKIPFTVHTDPSTITAPEIIDEFGYIISWPAFNIFDNDRYEQTGSYDLTVQRVRELIEYKVTFKGYNFEGTYTYTVESKNSFTAPAFPVKNYYHETDWPAFVLDFSDNLVVNAVYTPIEYTVTFKGHNFEEVRTYTVENIGSFAAPSVPQRDHYTASWQSFGLHYENILVEAVYTPIEYTVTFKGHNFEEVKTYTIENIGKFTAPSFPTRPHYNETDWPAFELNFDNSLVINAIYTPTVYTVTFMVDGSIFATRTYTIENKSITEPAVPQKTGYIASWEDYDLNALTNLTVNAEYIPIVPGTYYVTFVDENGIEIGKFTFTETTNPSEVILPSITEELGYKKYWPEFTLFDNDRYLATGSYDLTVQLKRELIVYKVTFKGYNFSKTYEYTIENKGSFTAPAVPQKPYYNGSWPEFTLDCSADEIIVNAEYVAIQYKVTFKGYNFEETYTYTVENKNSFTAPAVPQKPHYEGSWESFELNFDNDLVVNAKYVAIQYNIIFMVNGVKLDEKFYTVERPVISQPVDPPSRPGYTVSWGVIQPEYRKNQIIEAIYTPIGAPQTYYITFKDFANNIVQTVAFDRNTNLDTISAPSYLPTQPGYAIYWPEFKHLIFSNEIFNQNGTYSFTVIMGHDLITYTSKFWYSETNFITLQYTVEDIRNGFVEMPSLPVITDRGVAVNWSVDTLPLENADVKLVYSFIDYYLTFDFGNGETVQIKFNVKTDPESIVLPQLPSKKGYTAQWESFTLLDNSIYDKTNSYDQTIKIEFIPITYYATFVDEEGTIVGKIPFNVKDTSIVAPKAPAKPGYNVSWPEYTLFDEELFEETDSYSFTVEAVYDIITYTATFKVDGVTVAIIPFTVETGSIVEPAITAKPGYTAKWSDYTLGAGNITVNAIYSPITYIATFKVDGMIVAEIPFTAGTESIVEPAIKEKPGYTAKWSDYTLGSADITIEAVYSTITYTATFKIDGVIVATIPFTVETDSLVEPAITAKPGYTAKWSDYTLGAEDITIEAVYSIITYTATFKVNGEIVATIPFTVETDSLVEPAITAKPGYTAKWSDYTLGTENIIIEAVYSPITYTVTFMADGVVVGTQTYTVENKNITEPAVPSKNGYSGSWEAYTLDTGDKTVNAVYTKEDETFYITFVDMDGNIIEKIPFTVDTDPSLITAPLKTPEKAGYKVSWPSFTLFDDERYDETGSYSLTVKAVYEPIQYTATFKVNGKIVASIPFTVETKSLVEPSIPAKAGYTASWNKYSLGTEDITIEAVYTVISYSVTFMADGKEVAVLYYTVEDTSIQEPEVPLKKGYSGKWEDYTLDIGDKVVNAKYTKKRAGGSEDAPIFWWIMLGSLSAAGIAIGSIFLNGMKKSGKRK